MNTFVKDTSLGQIKGLKMDDGTVQYRGVRYANADRWTYPVGTGKWDGVYDATEYGAACVQLRTFFPESKQDPLPFYYKEFREGIEFKYSEDCFFLDIYAPENAQNADVIIYIHGGAFLGGCGCELHMDGTAYAKRNIIFVSINYRLGILGFLADKKLAEESGHSGNYGLYDQLEAIKWVHAHIADFGGNPENITLFGQSAGAMSVQQHCLSPLTKPYFKKVYMASGGGIGKDFAYVGPVEDSYGYWKRLTDLLGDSPEQWRAQPVDKLFDAFGKIADPNLMQHCCPHIDRLIIEKSPEKTAQNLEFADVPYLLSTNSQDMVPEALHAMSKDWCKLVNDNGGNAYYFYFSRQLPGDEAGAFHSAELWYTLGTWHKSWRPFSDYDREISESLLKAITGFAKYGNPCCDKIPDWKPFKDEYDALIISDTAIGSKIS